MTERRLEQCRILVVEDEYLLADELTCELEEAGAYVLGPVSNVAAAISLLDKEQAMDGAVLDINLGGEPAFRVADALIERSVPFVFTTGYDACVLPERFVDFPRCEKPLVLEKVITSLVRVTHR